MKKIFLILSLALLAAGCVPKVNKVALNKEGGTALEENQSSVIQKNWKTYKNEKYAFLFKYPETKYLISHIDSDEYLKELNYGVLKNFDENSIWIDLSDFALLKKTIKETCDIALKEKPDDPSCYFRSASQEDFLATEKTFQEHSFTNFFENKLGSNGPVNFLTIDGRPAIKQVIWSLNGEYYTLIMRVFDKKHNLVELSYKLPVSASKDEALEYLEGDVFKNIISSFKFIK